MSRFSRHNGRITMPSPKQVEEERIRLGRRKQYKKALASTIAALLVVAATAVLVATLFFTCFTGSRNKYGADIT